MKDLKSFMIVWKKMMRILSRNQKILGLFVFFFSLIAASVELLGVSVILPLLNAFLNPKELLDEEYLASLFFLLKVNSDRQIVLTVVILVIVVYLFKNAFLMFNAWFQTKYAMKVKREISLEAINSYMKQGYYFFRSHNTAIILRGTTSAAGGIEIIIANFFILLSDVLTIVCVFAYLFITDYKITVSVAGIAGFTIIVIINGFRKFIKKLSIIAYEKTAIVNQWLLNICYGIKEILVMNKKDFFSEQYKNNYIDEQRIELKQSLIQGYPRYMIEFVCVVTLMMSVFIRSLSLGDMTAFVPQLGVFAVAAFRIMQIVGNISSRFSLILFKLPCIDELHENLSSIESSDESSSLQNDNDLEHVFASKLDIKDISYKYPDGQDYILKGVSLSILKGQSIAFVGPSGAGKSTFADLILGLYNPTSGKITMDGMDIFRNKEMWAQNVGFVPQSVYLLDDTIRRNVAFGLLDKDIDEKRVLMVLEQAQLRSFIESLPAGLDTKIGERGVRFSGGQAQRLAIARALYRDPQIIVFDEATSALDNETEHAVMEAIEALQGEKTMIIIAHRLTTVRNCDHIYEIKNGKAIERQYEELQ